MKRYLLFVLPVLLLASCAQYNNTIQSRDISQSPVAYDTANLTHGDPTPVYDSIYVVSPTWSQAWKWAGQRNNRVWFWVGIALFIIPMGVFIYMTSRGANSFALLLLPAFAILVGGGIAGGSVQWERWNMDQNITKTQYDALMKDPGNLGPFWDTIRIK